MDHFLNRFRDTDSETKIRFYLLLSKLFCIFVLTNELGYGYAKKSMSAGNIKVSAGCKENYQVGKKEGYDIGI